MTFFNKANKTIFLNDSPAHHEMERLFLIFGILISSYCFLDLYLDVLQIQAWRHDELLLMPDYLGKLREDGRWLNYVVFDFVKEINPQICAAASLLCWGYFSFVTAKRVSNDLLFSCFFSLICLQVPSFYSIIGWSQTLVPSMIVLAALTWLSSKLRMEVVFLVGGVLFFGGLNNFYNLLPLLFLRDIYENGFKFFLRFFAWWVFCFLLGCGACIIFTKIIGGSWGLQIPEWRQTNPVHDLHDFHDNFVKVYKDLKTHLGLAGRSLVITSLSAILSISVISCLGRIKSAWNYFLPLIAIIAVALAVYVQSIPLGLYVLPRTAFPFFVACFCLILYLFRYSKSVGILIGILMAVHSFLINSDSVRYQATIPNTWIHHLKAIHTEPSIIANVHLCMTNDEVAESEQRIVRSQGLKDRLSEWFGEDYRLAPSLKAAGFNHSDWSKRRCKNTADLDREHNQMFEWAIENDEMYLWFYKARP